MRTAASPEKMVDGLYILFEQAEVVRHLWKDAKPLELQERIKEHTKGWHRQPGPRMARRIAIGLYLEGSGFFGIEYLGVNRQNNDVDYLNSGDTYSPTLVFAGDRLFVSDIGTLIETKYIKEKQNG